MANFRGFRAIGQVGFCRDYLTFDHIYILRAMIEEARLSMSLVFSYFGDFRKTFHIVP